MPCRLAACTIALWACLLAPGAAGQQNLDTSAPFARIGKAVSQPEYHAGKFKAFGWGESTAFCGMRDANLPGAPFVGKDASWWLTYDKEALYIVCFVRLEAQGEHFLAATAADNDPVIFQGDHLIIQFALDPDVGKAGVPFTRIAVNPSGAVWAETVEAMPGQNHPLDIDRLVYGNHVGSAHVSGHWWLARLRIPLYMLGVESLDGRTAKLHLAWSTEPLYLSWGGVQAGEWERMPIVDFASRPRTSLRLNGSYPLLFQTSGGLNLDLSSRILAGSADSPTRFRFILRNVSEGETTWEKVWEGAEEAGESMKFHAREHIVSAPDVENRLLMRAETTLDGDTQLLFHSELPYRPDDERVEAALAEWRRLHAYEPEANATFDYVYAPYAHKLEARVNTELNVALYTGEKRAKAERIQGSDRLRVVIADAAGKVMGSGDGAVINGSGRAVAAFNPPLPEGEYTVELSLSRGDTLADSAEMALVRERFEWEHTTLGKERVIIPPWTGISLPSADGGVDRHSRVAMWGREYRLANTGLPAAMRSQGEHVLGDTGMSLTGVIDGATVVAIGDSPPAITLIPGQIFPADFASYELAANACPVAGEDFQLEATDGYAVEVEAASALGPVDVRVHGRVDYDGLYTIRMTLAAATPVTVERLTLTVPIHNQANLYRFSRTLDLHSLGAIPQGEGVLRKSSNLPPHPALTGNFVPVVFAGDYDRGLFWMAESDLGWSVEDDQEQVTLVREDGQLQLRFHLFAKATVVDQPRTLEFAFLATPSRPKAVGYRQAFFAGKHTHDTAGFRFYGGGVNGFQLYTAEDYEGLRRFLYEDEDGIRDHYYDEADKPEGHGSYYRVRSTAAQAGHPLTLYGCTWGANAGMKEFATFGSAWTHTARTLEVKSPHTEFLNWTNFGGTAKWDSPAELTSVYTLMDDSFVDAWLWHMVRIGKYSGVNGCFFDCFESLPRALRGRVKTDINGIAYRREADGQLRPFANPLRYHRRTRRFATALWLAGRPPAMLQSNNFDNTYGPTWFVEGDMYLNKLGDDFIDQGITPDVYAAYTASSSGMAKATSHVATAPGPNGRPIFDDAIFSMILAYGILHDIAHSGNPHWLSSNYQAVTRALTEELDIGDPSVRHIPYWRPDGALTLSDPRVLAGGYVHPDKQRALIAVLNPTEETITVDVAFELLNRAPTAIREILSGARIADGTSFQLELEPHAVRFMMIE